MANVQHQQHHHVSGWTGWIGFAGILLIVSSIFHVLFGIGGIVGQDWYLYASGDVYLFDSSDWGWSMVAGGLLLFLSATLLLMGNMVGRILGVLLAVGSILVNIALLPAAPVWSVLVIAFDIVLIYAILAHGGEMKHLDEEV